ncbi:MAG: DUF1460 domain-containing protein [Muribaculaceae bacterium]|nr:DUF1460 domain-containing protein [Muribaculaceae bacterium]
MKRGIFCLLTCVISTIIPLYLSGAVRYHCNSDYQGVEKLMQAAAGEENYGKRIVKAARSMVGVPLGKAADNDTVGTIIIRLDTLSQREFINYALAAAKAAMAVNPDKSDFEKALESVSRKKGTDNGFVSQFFYGSDWIQDNISRGNLKEMTDYLDGGSFKTKSLDYVTRHRDEFPAMADSATYEKMRAIEMGFRSHRIPHQKKQSIGNKSVVELLKDGDIIIMLPPEDDFDIYDIGIVAMDSGQPRLIHVSRQNGKVVEDEYDLKRLFKIEGQFFYGYRWLRPTE